MFTLLKCLLTGIQNVVHYYFRQSAPVWPPDCPPLGRLSGRDCYPHPPPARSPRRAVCRQPLQRTNARTHGRFWKTFSGSRSRRYSIHISQKFSKISEVRAFSRNPSPLLQFQRTEPRIVSERCVRLISQVWPFNNSTDIFFKLGTGLLERW